MKTTRFAYFDTNNNTLILSSHANENSLHDICTDPSKGREDRGSPLYFTILSIQPLMLIVHIPRKFYQRTKKMKTVFALGENNSNDNRRARGVSKEDKMEKWKQIHQKSICSLYKTESTGRRFAKNKGKKNPPPTKQIKWGHGLVRWF